jgi:ABC-type antimicrobial peptide transport system permease subunit
MQLKPITLPEALLVSALGGALGVFGLFLFAAGASLGSPFENLQRFLSLPNAWLVVTGTFAIAFAATMRWMLMMYWQQRR